MMKAPLNELVIVFSNHGSSELFHRAAVKQSGFKPGDVCSLSQRRYIRAVEETLSLNLMLSDDDGKK